MSDDAELEIAMRKLLGKPPFDHPSNICWNDGYFAKSITNQYGEAAVEAMRKKLEAEPPAPPRRRQTPKGPGGTPASARKPKPVDLSHDDCCILAGSSATIAVLETRGLKVGKLTRPMLKKILKLAKRVL